MKTLIIVFAVLFAALLTAASFFDLRIAEYIYNPESAFAKFFAAVGMAPQGTVQILSPAMILAAFFELRRTVKAPVMTAAVAALALATAASLRGTVAGIARGTGVSAAVLAAVSCFLILVLFLAALPFVKKKPKELLITALIGLIAVNAGNAILQTLNGLGKAALLHDG